MAPVKAGDKEYQLTAAKKKIETRFANMFSPPCIGTSPRKLQIHPKSDCKYNYLPIVGISSATIKLA